MIHEALKQLRKFNGYTQQELAKELKISRSFLCEIETGEKNPTLKLIDDYAELFDLPASSILLFSENMSTKSFKGTIKVSARNKVLKLLEWANG